MTCPICKRPTTWNDNRWRPFCSERCQVIDLGAWAGEEYRFPVDQPSLDQADPDSGPRPA